MIEIDKDRLGMDGRGLQQRRLEQLLFARMQGTTMEKAEPVNFSSLAADILRIIERYEAGDNEITDAFQTPL
ncbi:hypothetical protein [Rhizobium sp. OAE497]|uniref:hypothetical protein n=1 Tax=Rhizobium sp. OAE497 TaxID=2663796 RepID=UPI0018F5BFEB